MTTSDPQRWARLRELFGELLHLDSSTRAQRLAEIGADDSMMSAELEELLRADAESASDDRVTSRLSAAVEELAAEASVGHSDRIPHWIGDYRVRETLGSGGMGVVYLAEQQSPHRTVALKVIRGFGGETAIRRFRREAELHGRLQHPNIALVYEAGLAPERDEHGVAHGAPRPFFAMEYIRGESVTAYAAQRHLSVEQRLGIMTRVCDAIDHAHARGVIHRDLKSANILVDEHGQPKVLDFGIARALDRDHAATVHTAVGEVIGTLPYMSPEQVSGQSGEVGVASDVYALGVVLFELLTDRRPLEVSGRTIADAVRMITDDEPTRLGSIDRIYRGDLETIVSRCLEKDPRRRYASAGALAEDLRRHLEHRPIEARPATTLYQLRKFARRHRPLVIGVATAFVALIAATVVSVVMMIDARRARDDLKVQLKYAQVENNRSSHSFKFLSDLLTAADPANSGGNDMTVRSLVLKAAEALREGAGGDDQVTGMLGRLIGLTLLRLGDVERAERALRRSVELLSMPDENAQGPQFTLFQAMTDLADLLRNNGRYDDAEVVLNQIIELRSENIRRFGGAEETPGAAEDADVFRSVALNNLALIHQQRGDFVVAEQMARRALEMERRLVEMGHQRQRAMAIASWNVGACLRKQGRAADAEAPLREALAIALEAEGPDGRVPQDIGIALASVLYGLGRYGEAVEVTLPVVESCERRLAHGSPELALAQIHLAQYLSGYGRPKEGLALALRSVDGSRLAGTTGTDLTSSLVILASLMGATGDPDGGAQLLAEAQSILDASAGDSSTAARAELLATQSALARFAGHVTEARALAERAEAMAMSAPGATKRAGFSGRREGALALLASSDAVAVARGEEELRRHIEELRGVFGDDHPIVSRMLLHLAESELARGDRDAARAHAEEAAERLARSAGIVPWTGEYAALVAALARDAAFVGSEEFRERAESIRAQIIAAAGERAPDLARLRRLAEGSENRVDAAR